MFATHAQPTLTSLFPVRPASRSSLLDVTPNHDAIEERLREIAHAEARAHVRMHGRSPYQPPCPIQQMAHVLAILKDNSMCGSMSHEELKQFTAAYWAERELMSDFLACQLPLF